MVAGAAAIFLSRFPTASPALVRHALELAADQGTPVGGGETGTTQRMVSREVDMVALIFVLHQH